MIFYSHSFKVQTLNLALNLSKYMLSYKPPSLPMHYIWKYRPICLFDHYSQHDIPAYLPATQPLPFFKPSNNSAMINLGCRVWVGLEGGSCQHCNGRVFAQRVPNKLRCYGELCDCGESVEVAQALLAIGSYSIQLCPSYTWS